MKQETIGIILNLDLDSGVERGRGLGGRKKVKKIGERVFLTGTFPQRPFSSPSYPPPPTIPLPLKYSMTLTNLIEPEIPIIIVVLRL